MASMVTRRRVWAMAAGATAALLGPVAAAAKGKGTPVRAPEPEATLAAKVKRLEADMREIKRTLGL